MPQTRQRAQKNKQVTKEQPAVSKPIIDNTGKASQASKQNLISGKHAPQAGAGLGVADGTRADAS